MRSGSRWLMLLAGAVACSGLLLLLPGRSCADGDEADLKVSREIIIESTRIVLLQVSRTTLFTDNAEGKPPQAIPCVRVEYLLENLGDKGSDAILGDVERAFAAGTNKPAIRGLPESNSRNVMYEDYSRYLKRAEGGGAPLPRVKVKDANAATVVMVTFVHVEVTAPKMDLRLRVGLHKGEDRRVLFRNVPME